MLIYIFRFTEYNVLITHEYESERKEFILYQFILNFFVYGFLGWCTEVAFAACKEQKFVNRGFLNGPICPIYGFGVSTVLLFLTPFQDNLIMLYLISTIVVTALEWLTGFLLERLFHSRWWDYSDMPLNLNGYVCLLFSVIWGAACVFIVKVFHPLIAAGITFLPHAVGLFLIAVLVIATVADTYVTASGIFKMNKRLEHMEQIAGELHSISDTIGENIYKNVMETIQFTGEKRRQLEDAAQELREKRADLSEELRERREDLSEGLREKREDLSEGLREKREDLSEELRDRREDISEELRSHIAELYDRYQELQAGYSRIHKRLVKAFPRMRSDRYSKSLRDLQEYLRSRRK